MRPFSQIAGAAVAIAVIGMSVAPMARADAHGSLKEIMRHLGQAMGRVSDAIWVEDYPTIAKAASEIGGHQHVSPQEQQHVKRALGNEMGKFVAMDHAAHEAAMAMKAAAERKDMAMVLRQHAQVQQACVTCHTTFRQRILDAK